jgi:hypothetical protein
MTADMERQEGRGERSRYLALEQAAWNTSRTSCLTADGREKELATIREQLHTSENTSYAGGDPRDG